MKGKKKSTSRKVFILINGIVLFILTAVCILPFINVLAISFSGPAYVQSGQVNFLPKGFNLDSYSYLFKRPSFWRAFFVSVLRVILGTMINLIFILLTAYPLSKESARFQGRTLYVWYFFVTMLIGGGMIPNYLLITGLGLRNTIWALVLPGALPVFNLVLMLNFFRQIPKEMEEASLIDGAGHLRTLIQIYVPCSLAAIATISLFCIVSHWNAWFDGMLYMTEPGLQPLQTYLRNVIINQKMSELTGDDWELYALLSDRGLRSSQIIIAVIPVLCVYPFLQRYFVKGIVLGSVKG